MKRLWIVYNPRSSRHGSVEEEVLAEARELRGMMLGKYEIKPTSVEKNVAALAKLLEDGDLVVTAGGDGTAIIGVNAVMKSEKKAVFAVLGYGNFNDMSRMMGARKRARLAEIVEKYRAGMVRKVFPIEIEVNGKFWRYAMCYATFGLFAESTEIFDDEKIRKKLQSGKKSRLFSWWHLAKWYFRNRKKRVFVPECSLNGVKMPSDMTDYVAINSVRMAGVMRGREWFLDKKKFGRATGKLGSFPKLVALMTKSIFRRVPTVDVEEDVLEFVKPGEIEVQVEGEYRRLTEVSKITLKKAGRGIEMVKL